MDVSVAAVQEEYSSIRKKWLKIFFSNSCCHNPLIGWGSRAFHHEWKNNCTSLVPHEKSMEGEKTNERIMSEETVRVQKLAQVSLFRSFCGNMRMKTEKPASTWNQTHETQCR
jgi:hypothetical protein